jgi:hypothetical protein
MTPSGNRFLPEQNSARAAGKDVPNRDAVLRLDGGPRKAMILTPRAWLSPAAEFGWRNPIHDRSAFKPEKHRQIGAVPQPDHRRRL